MTVQCSAREARESPRANFGDRAHTQHLKQSEMFPPWAQYVRIQWKYARVLAAGSEGDRAEPQGPSRRGVSWDLAAVDGSRPGHAARPLRDGFEGNSCCTACEVLLVRTSTSTPRTSEPRFARPSCARPPAASDSLWERATDVGEARGVPWADAREHMLRVGISCGISCGSPQILTVVSMPPENSRPCQ